MKIEANSPDEYIRQLSNERKGAIKQLRKTVIDNLPEGFVETMNYGYIGYVVPHSIYPDGYHVDPKEPLPFINLASQKNHIALYHMGMYAKPELLEWFTKEYPKHCETKLDMGKSCIRFKKPENIPFKLIGELCTKMTTDEWVNIYETSIKR